jgi:hypothetical protein
MHAARSTESQASRRDVELDHRDSPLPAVISD